MAMDEVMGDLKSLFDAFYERLVLRDFLGKVIPGLVLLSTVCASVAWIDLPPKECLNSVNILINLSFLSWLAIFGVAWLVCFAVQSFGEWSPWRFFKIEYYPHDVFPCDECYYKFRRKFDEKATREGDRIEAERLTVIMEACGNGYVSIVMSIVFVILYYLIYCIKKCCLHCFEWQMLTYGFEIWGLVFLFAIFLAVFLGRMHRCHNKRLYKYMKVVVEN